MVERTYYILGRLGYIKFTILPLSALAMISETIMMPPYIFVQL